MEDDDFDEEEFDDYDYDYDMDEDNDDESERDDIEPPEGVMVNGQLDLKKIFDAQAAKEPDFANDDGAGGWGFGSCYQFVDPKGVLAVGYVGCMSRFNTPHKGWPAWMNWIKSNMELKPVFLQYILDPVHSPWKDAVKGSHRYTSPDGKVMGYMITDTKHDVQLMQSLCKTSRIYTEKFECGRMFNHLIDAGVHPGVALFTAVCWGVSTDDPNEKPVNYRNWHGAFRMGTEGVKSLERFLKGEHKCTNKDTMFDGCTHYYGVDSIWQVPGEPELTVYLTKTYPNIISPAKVEQGRFGSVTVGGLTRDSLTKALLQLQQDMKLEKYIAQ